MTDSNYKVALLCSSGFQIAYGWWRKKLDHKFQRSYGALFVYLGANTLAADEHKPKGAFAAPGLICCTITTA